MYTLLNSTNLQPLQKHHTIIFNYNTILTEFPSPLSPVPHLLLLVVVAQLPGHDLPGWQCTKDLTQPRSNSELVHTAVVFLHILVKCIITDYKG